MGLLLLLFQEELTDRVRAYLESGRDPAVEKVAIADLEKAVRAAFRKPAGTRGKAEGKVDDIEYRLWDPGKEHAPILVTLHGQNGKADDWLAYRLQDLGEPDFYVLAPQAGRAGWGHSRLGYAHVLKPLLDVLAKHSVDFDRVWLDGMSMGGHGTWQVGSLHADRFAALAPRCGQPHYFKRGEEVVPMYARNLRNVPVFWTVGAQDKLVPIEPIRKLRDVMAPWPNEMEYREADGGHEWFPAETPRIMKWMESKTRAADPKEIRWSTWESLFPRAYWLEILEFAGRETTKIAIRDFENKEIETRTFFPSEVRVTASISKNKIEIQADHVKKMRIWLNDRLVDLSKPVVVRFNKKEVFNKKVDVSPKRLLDEVRRRGDPSFLYPAEVTVP